MAAITSYTTLAPVVQSYLASAAYAVPGQSLDWYIAEAEQEMNARLRVRRMLTSVTPTVSSAGVVTLPTDYGGWKRFTTRDGTSEWDLALASAQQKPDIQPVYGAASRPLSLVTVGLTSQIWPYTDGAYTFVGRYYGRIPNLTYPAPTNWILTNFR